MNVLPAHHNASIVACARWESPYIVEWIVYHLNLGFDHIHLYCNDDDPKGFKAALRSLPPSMAEAVSYRPYFGQGLQAAMYLDALPRARRSSDWICILDIDEFLVLKAWDSIGALTRWLAARGIASLHLNWVFYGHNGHATRPGSSVLGTYTRRALLPDAHTKHISRASCFEPHRIRAPGLPFWHGLASPHWSGFDRRTVLGHAVEPLLDRFPAEMLPYVMDEGRAAAILDAGYIAHFVFKSRDDFRLRVARGLGGNFAGQAKWGQALDAGQTESILEGMNEVEDRYLAERFGARTG